MTRPRLVVLSRRGPASLPDDLLRRLDAACELTVVRLDRAPDHTTAIRLLRDADLLGATNLCLPRLDPLLLDALPRLRGVVLLATGYDHLDVPQLERRGIGVSVLPEYATGAVAEHALAMLLALATRLHLANDRSRGAVAGDASLRGVELAGRTVGVVGVGRIGGRLTRLARGIGMRVLGTDTDPAAVRRAVAGGVEMTDLPDLLERSDAVALAASHEYGRPAVLGPRELHRLRPGAFLVNVGRPALVDTPAVAAALRTRRLRGYAVDDVVLDPVRDADLAREGRVLQTGHSAWWRDEVLDRGARMWGEHLLAAVEGRPLDAVTWPGENAAMDGTAAGAPIDLRAAALPVAAGGVPE
jgi:phosphoglycerate dehydrogenase-like enzyme